MVVIYRHVHILVVRSLRCCIHILVSHTIVRVCASIESVRVHVSNWLLTVVSAEKDSKVDEKQEDEEERQPTDQGCRPETVSEEGQTSE